MKKKPKTRDEINLQRSYATMLGRLAILPRIKLVALIQKRSVMSILKEALELWWQQTGSRIFKSKGGVE